MRFYLRPHRPVHRSRMIVALAALLALAVSLAAALSGLVAHSAQAQAASPSAASASTAPLLPGEHLWNGVPSYLFGAGDTYDYIGAAGFQQNPAIQRQVKAAGVPLIRAFFESVDETDHKTPVPDSKQLQIAQAIQNSGAQCMANITQPVSVSQALHLVSILKPYCRYFEVYNEPDIGSGNWPPAVDVSGYLSFWNAFVPQARALDPNALFGGPALATEFGLDDPNYMHNVLSGMASSGVVPDFVTYHWYVCSGLDKSSCLPDAAQWTPGHGKTVYGWIQQDFPNKAVPLGITEWNADPGNPNWAYDDSFMSQFEQTALAGFEKNPYLSFATQFDIGSYAGYGSLDLFRTSYPETPSLDYSNTPLAIGSARPMFGVLAGEIASLSGRSAPTPTPTTSSTTTPTTTTTTTPTTTPTMTTTTTPTNTPRPTPTTTPAPGTTLFSDDFQSDTLGAAPRGWTSASGNWTVQQDGTTSSGLPNLALAQGNPSTANEYTISAGSAAWTDYTVQASVKPGANDLTQTSDLMARFTDPNNHYSFLLKNGDQWYLGLRSGGAWTTFAQGSFPYASQFSTLALTVHGATISGAINGQVVATATDATF
ncbi:MAG: LamG-like jellyroll fold domain-containing protein, partial [Ktedonobacterales bacterium]